MISDYMLGITDEILKAMPEAQRSIRGGVQPKHIQARLPYARHVGSVRRDMHMMYKNGLLVRVGSDTSRQGYRLPSAMEKIAWRLNRGFYPVGSELRFVGTAA